MKVFIGMEKSGRTRRAFAAKGHDVISCDLQPADDAAPTLPVEGLFPDTPSQYLLGLGCHIQGDVFEALEALWPRWWPDLAIFHPDCTYMTVSAAWAYKDGPYHQKLKPETLVGADRRKARDEALEQFRRILALDIEHIAVENPAPSFINTAIRAPDQIIQPYQFGDDASKSTGLWLVNLPPLVLPPKDQWVQPRTVDGKPRWANQTDSGQNALSPSASRAADRADTYPGIAEAFTQWAAA